MDRTTKTRQTHACKQAARRGLTFNTIGDNRYVVTRPRTTIRSQHGCLTLTTPPPRRLDRTRDRLAHPTTAGSSFPVSLPIAATIMRKPARRYEHQIERGDDTYNVWLDRDGYWLEELTTESVAKRVHTYRAAGWHDNRIVREPWFNQRFGRYNPTNEARAARVRLDRLERAGGYRPTKVDDAETRKVRERLGREYDKLLRLPFDDDENLVGSYDLPALKRNLAYLDQLWATTVANDGCDVHVWQKRLSC